MRTADYSKLQTVRDPRISEGVGRDDYEAILKHAGFDDPWRAPEQAEKPYAIVGSSSTNIHAADTIVQPQDTIIGTDDTIVGQSPGTIGISDTIIEAGITIIRNGDTIIRDEPQSP